MRSLSTNEEITANAYSEFAKTADSKLYIKNIIGQYQERNYKSFKNDTGDTGKFGNNFYYSDLCGTEVLLQW